MLVPKTRCDEKGDIYVVESGGRPLGVQNGLSLIPVLQLSITSKSTVTYPIPSLDRYRSVVRLDFDASADGHFYSLLEAADASPSGSDPQPSFFIARYRDDGTTESYFKLDDAPDGHIQPFRFAIFRDGNVLVAGTAVTQGKPLRSFVAVLDRSGRFVKYVKAYDDENAALKASEDRRHKKKNGTVPGTPPEVESTAPESDVAVELSSSSFMVGGPDGNVYLLRGTDQHWLYVISPAGEVVRHFQIPEPTLGLTPTNMGVAGENGVFIAFGRVQGGNTAGTDSQSPDNLISVVSAQTGDVNAVYRLPASADAFEVPGCAISSDNFLFLGTTEDGQHQQVTRYSPK